MTKPFSPVAGITLITPRNPRATEDSLYQLASSDGANAPLSIESMVQALSNVIPDMSKWEREFNALARRQGFDLNNGAQMFVPPSFNMQCVPPRYRSQVRVHAQVYEPSAVYFTAGLKAL